MHEMPYADRGRLTATAGAIVLRGMAWMEAI
jgi:hypothetical protein